MLIPPSVVKAEMGQGLLQPQQLALLLSALGKLKWLLFHLDGHHLQGWVLCGQSLNPAVWQGGL